MIQRAVTEPAERVTYCNISLTIYKYNYLRKKSSFLLIFQERPNFLSLNLRVLRAQYLERDRAKRHDMLQKWLQNC